VSDIVKRLHRQVIIIGMVGGDPDRKLLLEEAKAEIIKLREERRWIPVGERLPPDEKWVDVAGRWYDGIGWHDGDYWVNVDEDPFPSQVTHWRKRPPGPEGDA
jgi:hypothetical protein